MRNLHRERIYYNTAWFIALLAEMGLHFEPEKDERILRRFIIGEKMYPMPTPERSEVRATIELPLNIDNSASSVAGLVGGFDDALRDALRTRGIDEASITHAEHYTDSDNGGTYVEVTYMRPETDAELAQRQDFVTKFNALVAQKDEIYRRIDAAWG